MFTKKESLKCDQIEQAVDLQDDGPFGPIRFRETGWHSRRPGQRRRKVTNAVDDWFLRFQVLRERAEPAIALS